MVCKECKYVEFEHSSYICVRNAPVPGSNEYASWPKVKEEWTCGEFADFEPSGLATAQELLGREAVLGKGDNAFGCADCVYSSQVNSFGVYECRRRPPIVSETATWPEVKANDFCGDLAIYVEGG